MIRRWLATTVLLFALSMSDGRPAAAIPDDTCTQQSRRVRLPGGFAGARLAFSGLLKSGRTRVGEQFTMSDLRELRVIVNWTEADAAHLQRVDLYAPDGTLYQRFAGSFTGDRRPVSVATRVPVAGSSITDSSLFGEWCAEVFLDDDDAPIARRRFELLEP
ncbi:MAG TPA: hypothetical protein VFW70_17140 [Methylomirabilota bacterium]|nr:hypothetical protein [Methylomirabilota bacterium]